MLAKLRLNLPPPSLDHEPQPDLDGATSYQQLQRDARDDKKHPTAQMFKQLVDRMYTPVSI